MTYYCLGNLRRQLAACLTLWYVLVTCLERLGLKINAASKMKVLTTQAQPPSTLTTPARLELEVLDQSETPKPNAEEFAHFFGDIFASDTGLNSDELRALLEETSANGLPDVEPFTILELQVVLKEMRRNKCADTSGLVAECFI